MAVAFLSLHDVGDELGVSVQTVRRWVKAGALPAYKPGKEYRIKPSDLEEFLKTREVGPKVESAPPLDFEAAAGPTLLEKGLDAARHDEEKDRRAVGRLLASEGTPQATHSYEEDVFRVTLRECGFPDEAFEGFTWPLLVMARRAELLEQEIARLRGEVEAPEKVRSE